MDGLTYSESFYHILNDYQYFEWYPLFLIILLFWIIFPYSKFITYVLNYFPIRSLNDFLISYFSFTRFFGRISYSRTVLITNMKNLQICVQV